LAKGRRRVWGIIRNVILILAGLVAVFFLVVVPWFFSSLITTHSFHFPDRNDGKTPRSYNMDFSWVAFASTDGVPLKGWYMPATGNAKGTIVYCHGLNRTRVEMLPMAQYGHELGYNGVLFDLRHQGQSGGRMGTLGYQERKDVLGAVRFALEQEKAARPLVVWGVSMGAAAALMAAAGSPKIDAVISDSAWTTLHELIAHHAKLFLGLPSFPIPDEITYWVAWRGGFRPSQFNLETAVERLGRRPALFIGVERDRRMPPAYAQELYAVSQSPQKALIIVPGHRHGEGFSSGSQQYEQAVAQFLARIPSGPDKEVGNGQHPGKQ